MISEKYSRSGLEQYQRNDKFSIKKLYNAIRLQFQKVWWRKITVKSKAIPKNIFILWLAAQRKLAIMDRLRRWGNIVDTECVLCDTNEKESTEHIWFGCRYTKAIWYTLVNWLHEKYQIGTWDDEIKWLTSRNPSRTYGEIRVFLFAAMLYHDWIERNNRRFQGKAVEARQKIKDIALELHLTGQKERKWQKELERLKNYPSIV